MGETDCDCRRLLMTKIWRTVALLVLFVVSLVWGGVRVVFWGAALFGGSFGGDGSDMQRHHVYFCPPPVVRSAGKAWAAAATDADRLSRSSLFSPPKPPPMLLLKQCSVHPSHGAGGEREAEVTE